MNPLKPAQKSDIILKYFSNNQQRDLSANELSSYLQLTHPDIFTLPEIKGILSVLLNDRHIAITIPNFYKITLEGIVFLENGGYAVQRKADYVKRQYLEIAHRSGNQSSSLILWVLAALGLLVAYFILKYGYDHFNWKLPF